MSHDLTDLERLRLIYKALVRCGEGEAAELARQFKYETGRLPDEEMVERVLGGDNG